MKETNVFKIECSIDEELSLTYSVEGPEALRESLHQLVNNSLNSLVEDYVFLFLLKCKSN